MSDKVYVGNKMATFRSGGEYDPISRVTMWYDDDHYYTAGDDTGRELSCTNIWATQDIVNTTYERLKGFVYRPFEATGADIDPAAEVGDTVTINGIYSIIGRMDITYDAKCNINIAAPGEREVQHEVPYMSAQDRELYRRVKLEQLYYGAKISRREGLVIEKTDGESVKAKVVLNADELSFYNGEGGRVLYFDPTSGTYKFMGELNVNDKFVVDRFGNVTMNGTVNIKEGASWLQTRYSTNKNASVPDSWQEAWNDAWSNTTTQVWAIYSTNSGKTWTAPMLIQGKNGEQGPTGPQGSSANIPDWVKAYTASAQFNTLLTNEWVVSMNLFGSKIFGTEIYGGKITSDTTIDVGTDATIGRWLKLKSQTGKEPVGILFNGQLGVAPCIWSENDKFINISADYIGLIASGAQDSNIGLSAPLLDLSQVNDINWGNNRVPACFS